MGNDIFVKLNLKSIGEVRSLIFDKSDVGTYYRDRYLMCAGKHDKNGWTIVFRAKSYKEAEYIIEHNKQNLIAETNKDKQPIEQEETLDISLANRGRARIEQEIPVIKLIG